MSKNVFEEIDMRVNAFQNGQTLKAEDLFNAREWIVITDRALAGWVGMRVRQYSRLPDSKIVFLGTRKVGIQRGGGTSQRPLALYRVK